MEKLEDDSDEDSKRELSDDEGDEDHGTSKKDVAVHDCDHLEGSQELTRNSASAWKNAYFNNYKEKHIEQIRRIKL